jgi:hypothetical protein
MRRKQPACVLPHGRRHPSRSNTKRISLPASGGAPLSSGRHSRACSTGVLCRIARHRTLRVRRFLHESDYCRRNTAFATFRACDDWASGSAILPIGVEFFERAWIAPVRAEGRATLHNARFLFGSTLWACESEIVAVYKSHGVPFLPNSVIRPYSIALLGRGAWLEHWFGSYTEATSVSFG